ncbi:hypothetical protein WA026_005484 [Henosepilachna vigintioctopunctata]|uniref:Uncharacterized protein n=1 Tax=Henosepilachna vigintioctopunctata TaxID=420089 RepID=A0AAW1TSX0_9CUCU
MGSKERGIPLIQQRFWTECTNRANEINIESFCKHQSKYDQLTDVEPKKLVTTEMKEDLARSKRATIRSIHRHVIPKTQYPDIMAYNEGIIPTPWNYRSHKMN